MEISIADTFRSGTVLITGCTGLLGKVLTEKLLRSCPVKSIAILVRSKKGQSPEQRMKNIYDQVFFDRLRKEKPDFMNHVKVIDGGLEEFEIGSFTDHTDYQWLIENVNFIFHCAATVKFNEPLEHATKINIQGTEKVLMLASQMKKLKGFVHVSTAYSHFPRSNIDEKFYPVPITAKELRNMIESDELKPDVLGNWPNTYTFTKAIAEDMVSKNDYNLPISIFRPSIVGCTSSEPVSGWVDNMNGPTGIITGFIVGFLRTVPLDENKVTDIIPADYTVNALISVMCDTVKRYQGSCCPVNNEPKIYNYVSSVENPFKWVIYKKEIVNVYQKFPPLASMWYGFYIFYTNLWFGAILRLLLHRIPAAFVDVLMILSRKSPKMLRLYLKTDGVMDLLYPFSTGEWKFDISNTRQLWSSLSQEDRETFHYSFENFDWTNYVNTYYLGIRKYILHEDLSNSDKALSKNRKLFWLHHLLVVLIVYIIIQISWMFLKC